MRRESATTFCLIGASCRALAESVRRAIGPEQRIVAVDLFGDEDLRAACDEVHVVCRGDFPDGIDSLLDRLDLADRACAFLYGGGIENAPQVIRRLARRGTVLGCSAQSVEQVRDPVQWTQCLCDAGLPHAPVITRHRSMVDSSANTVVWMCKPIASAGGQSVHVRTTDGKADGKGTLSHPATISDRATYLQQRIDGHLVSATFLGNGNRACCLGVTRGITLGQVQPLHAASRYHPYLYAGSLGPLMVPGSQADQWQRIGNALTQRFGLRGLFGIDAILTCAGTITPIEINPRYTASMELFESDAFGTLATGCASHLITMHIQACRTGRLPAPHLASPADVEATADVATVFRFRSPVRCKQIVYARKEQTFTQASFTASLDRWVATVSGFSESHGMEVGLRIADIPSFGDSQGRLGFQSGDPMFTLLTSDVCGPLVLPPFPQSAN